jgi:ADP-heptose:LPS heptosyltransferase
MNVSRMRQIDHWLGMPICWLLTLWRKLFSRRSIEVASPRKILFIKLAEQGSTVLAQSALQAAVERVGRENVYFLLFAENRPILDLLDLIPPDNVIEIRAKGLFATVTGAVLALRRVRKFGVDATIDMEFFARSSAALSYLCGATWRVGFHASNGAGRYRGDLLTHRLGFNPYLHTSQVFRLLVDALDHAPDAFPRFDHVPQPASPGPGTFRASPLEVAEVREMLRTHLGRFAGTRLILLNANASDLVPLRRWPSDRYVDLARRLLGRHRDATVVFTGSWAEASAAQQLVAEVGSDRCASLAGRTTLRQLMVLYTLSEVLITNDSGPAHFATMTPIDVVVLFGPETPKLFAGIGERTHPLWAGLACSPCINAFNDRNSTCRDNACMKHIAVEQVFAATTQILETRRRVRNPAG